MSDLEIRADLLPCVSTELRKASRAIGRIYDEALAPLGLTTPQFSILRRLAREGTMPLSRLAEQLVMDRTSLYRAMVPLERSGWISVKAADKGPAKLAELTPSGLKLREQGEVLWGRAQSRVLDEFGPERWMHLTASIGDLTAVGVKLTA